VSNGLTLVISIVMRSHQRALQGDVVAFIALVMSVGVMVPAANPGALWLRRPTDAACRGSTKDVLPMSYWCTDRSGRSSAVARSDKALIQAQRAVAVSGITSSIADQITTSKRRYQRPRHPKCVKRSAHWIGY
jgi:hypothetical protein